MTALAQARRRPRKRWDGDLYVLDNTVVGSVSIDSFGRGWWAYGALEDWEDTPLGMHSTETKARKAVVDWVRENS